MKVIVAGFSKTGTKTMNAALRELGYNVYDFLEHFWYAGNQWTACMERGEIEGLREIYESVDAVCDAPAFFYWNELLELFPDAKVILMVRDEDSWRESMENQIKINNSNPFFRLLFISPTGFAMNRFLNCIGMTFSGLKYMWPWQGQCYEWRRAKRVYRMHNAYVMAAAPKGQLLVYDIREGWEPLCKFLEVETPNTPFPHKNKRGNVIEEMIREAPVMQRIKKEMTVIAVVVSTLLLVGCYKLAPNAVALLPEFW